MVFVLGSLKLEVYFIIYSKINFIWIKDGNVKYEIIKL